MLQITLSRIPKSNQMAKNVLNVTPKVVMAARRELTKIMREQEFAYWWVAMAPPGAAEPDVSTFTAEERRLLDETVTASRALAPASRYHEPLDRTQAELFHSYEDRVGNVEPGEAYYRLGRSCEADRGRFDPVPLHG